MMKLRAIVSGFLASSMIAAGGHAVVLPSVEAASLSQIHITKTMSLSFVGTPSVTATTALSAATPSFVSGKMGYAALDGEVIKTTDGGLTWKPVGRVGDDIQDISFTNQSDGLALVQDGGEVTSASQTTARYTWAIFRTVNGGQTWTRTWMKSVSEPPRNYAAANFRSFMFGLKGYALLDDNLLTTSNGGRSWKRVAVSGQVEDAVATGSDDLWVVSSTAPLSKDGDTNQRKVVLLHSTDGGQHFQSSFNTAPMDLWQAKLAFDSSGDGVLLVKDLDTWGTTVYWTTGSGEIWRRTEPWAYDGRVAQTEPVFGSSGIAYIALAPGAAPFAGGVTIFNARTGRISQPSVNGDWRYAQIGAVQGRVLYATASLIQGGEAIFRSADGGKSWSQVYPAGVPNIQIQFVSPSVGYGLGIDETSGYIYKTIDGGHKWMTLKKLNGLYPSAMAFVNHQSAYVSAYAPRGAGGYNLQMLVTHDGGASWGRAVPTQIPVEATDVVTLPSIPTALSASVSGISLTIASAYPTVVISTRDGKRWGMVASTANGLGIDSASYVNPGNLWLSSVTQNHVPIKTDPSVYTSMVYQVDGLDQRHGALVPLTRLPQNWTIIGMARPNTKDAFIYATKSLIANSSAALFATHDGGKTWIEYLNAVPAGSNSISPGGAPVVTKETSKAPAPVPLNLYPSGAVMNLSFINAIDGYMLSASGLLKTTDGGRTWVYVR